MIAIFMRYSRQILLGDIAIEGQQTLLNSHVLIVGLGGLGPCRAVSGGCGSRHIDAGGRRRRASE